MRYIAAYRLLQLAGNESPSASDIENVITSVGIDFDSGRAQQLINALTGKNVDELIAEGQSKLASVPAGGAVAGGAGAAAAGGADEAATNEAAKEEEADESDEDMGFGLFD
ncbi:60S acidic ribosomal protein P2 [Spiromyces aspiralis]|uniref:60S acidic ribosomal protein P2 n=1 Tax=Spiromyces aspiralis TaxID=68401 RepID=A0ACC1HMD3_9FUNG|nr:60S acidic ribosomal protein P2 [Spiromyces aspiralis]